MDITGPGGSKSTTDASTQTVDNRISASDNAVVQANRRSGITRGSYNNSYVARGNGTIEINNGLTPTQMSAIMDSYSQQVSSSLSGALSAATRPNDPVGDAIERNMAQRIDNQAEVAVDDMQAGKASNVRNWFLIGAVSLALAVGAAVLVRLMMRKKG